MRLKFLLGLFSICGLTVNADELPTFLTVWSKDGTAQVYALEKKPKISFSKTGLVIKAEDMEVAYDMEQLARFTYDNSDITGVSNLVSGKQEFSVKAGSICFPHLAANSVIAVYALDGTCVLKNTVQSAGAYVLPISALSTGNYLVKVNGVTTKIHKK